MDTNEKNTNSPETQNIVDQLLLQLLQQTELTNALQSKIADLNRVAAQQKQQLINARKEKHDADLEVIRLSTEVENITEELFEQANLQVKEANENAHDIKQLNDRLAQTIREKDTTIEILQSELSNLKTIISTFDSAANTPLSESQKNLSTPNLLTQSVTNDRENGDTSFTIPSEARFNSTLLEQFNEQPVYSPLHNQLRFDLPAFQLFSSALLHTLHTSANQNFAPAFDIKTSKFFLKLLDELDECLKLEKAPALQTFKLRWNRKTFLTDLMDKTVNIQPLSAATESWKNQTLQKYIPQGISTPSTPIIPAPSDEMAQLSRFATSSTSVSSYDPSMFKNATGSNIGQSPSSSAAPLAVTAACGLCGEKRRDMNYSRLYHLRILYASSENADEKSTKSDYPLCIYCSSKYRSVVELLKFLASLDPTKLPKSIELDDYIRSSWIKYVNLRAKVWYTTEIGLWNEKEMCGLVYGWQNNWLTNLVPNKEAKSPVRVVNEDNEESNNDTTVTEIFTEVGTITKSPVEDTTTSEPINESSPDSSTTSQKGHKGWGGWSGVIAKPKGEPKVDVGVGIGMVKRLSSHSKGQRNSYIEETADGIAIDEKQDQTLVSSDDVAVEETREETPTTETSSTDEFQDATAASTESNEAE